MSINSSKEALSYNWKSFLPFAAAGVLYGVGRCYRVKRAALGAGLVGLSVLIQSKMQKSVGGLKEKKRTDGFWNNTLLTTFTLTMIGLGAVVTNLSARTQLAAFGVLGALHLGYTYFKHQATTHKVEKIIKEVESLSQEIDGMKKNDIQNMKGKLEFFLNSHFRLLMYLKGSKVFDLKFKFFEKSLRLSPEFINESDDAQADLQGFADGALTRDQNPAPLFEYIKLLHQYGRRDLMLFSILDGHKENTEIQTWMEQRGNAIKQEWEAKAG